MTRTTEGDAHTHPRLRALREVAESAGDLSESRWLGTTAMLLVDSIIDADLPPLQAFLDDASALAAREVVDRRCLEAFTAVAQWGIARTLPAAIGRTIDFDSASGRILRFVAEQPGCSSKDLFMALSIAEETVSRAGAQLEADGLVIRARAGKWRRWRLTRAGENTLQAALLAQADADGPNSSEEMPEVLRRFADNPRESGEGATSKRPKRADGVNADFARRLQERKRSRSPGQAQQR